MLTLGWFTLKSTFRPSLKSNSVLVVPTWDNLLCLVGAAPYRAGHASLYLHTSTPFWSLEPTLSLLFKLVVSGLGRAVQRRREKFGFSLVLESWHNMAMVYHPLRLVLCCHSHLSLYPLQTVYVHTQGSNSVYILLFSLFYVNEKASRNIFVSMRRPVLWRYCKY